MTTGPTGGRGDLSHGLAVAACHDDFSDRVTVAVTWSYPEPIATRVETLEAVALLSQAGWDHDSPGVKPEVDMFRSSG